MSLFYWMLIVVVLLITYWSVHAQNVRARLQCPYCGNLFGKKAAKKIVPYNKHIILDEYIYAIFKAYGCTGHDGFIIHCDNCDSYVTFDNCNKIIEINDERK